MSHFMVLINRGVLVGSLLACMAVIATANDTGQFGSYQNGCGGFGCHDQSANTTVTLQGPTTVNPGATADYTFVIAHPNNGYGGFNVSFRTSTGGAAGTVIAGNGSQGGNGELTHTQPKQAAGGNVSFPFQWTAPNTHGTYTFYGAGNAVNNSGTSAGDAYNTTGAITILVPGATITSPNPGVGFCTGANLTVNWTQTGMQNFRIELSANDFANITVMSNSTPAANGTYTYAIPAGFAAATTYAVRLVNLTNNQEVARVSNLSIAGAPTIVQQPTNKEACEGTGFSLQVGAAAANPTYQWRKGGTPIPGATTATYTVNSAAATDAGSYDVTVTSCQQTTTSNAVTVTVVTKPTITQQPLPKTACEGASVTFTLVATGDGLTYQWTLNDAPIGNATQASYTIPAVNETHAGIYRCRVSGTCPPQRQSDTVRLTVLGAPTITTQPQNKTLQAGETLSLSVVASGTGLSYQWQKNNVDIPGATSKDYTKTGVARADSGLYLCKVWNQCDTSKSNTATVKINAAPGPGLLVLSTNTLDVGEVYLCEMVDTTLAGLLINEGGQPVVVSSVTTNPASTIEVVGLTTPLTIPSGGNANVTIRIKPQAIGPIMGDVTFLTAGGNKTLTVSGTVISAFALDQDTLKFEGATGETKCFVSIALPCATASITAAALQGDVSTFEMSPVVELPKAINQGETIDICFKTLNNNAAVATLTVVTSGGNATATLIRVPGTIDGVTDFRDAIAGLTVAPNPANEFVDISKVGATKLNVRILDLAGRTVASVSGSETLRWNVQDFSGRRVVPGLYILDIEAGNERTIQKVLVH